MTSNNSDNRSGVRAVAKGLVMAAGLGLAVYLARFLGLGDMLGDTQWFNEHVLGHGVLSVFIYLGVSAVFTAVGLPRQLIGFLGGFAFGVGWGTVLSTLGSGMGCALAACYARWGGRELVARKLGHRIGRLDGFLRHKPFKTALAIRFFPLGSNVLTNLAAGISSIPLVPFIVGSTLGYVPQSFIFALFGAGMNRESSTGVALTVAMAVVLFVVSIWIGMAVYRSYRKEAREAGLTPDDGE
ncbi:SNARE associated Golgi protein [Pseudodesulfovibrio cashew]|uniref:TVP38/TMEM64 family membrane protein n=1 Tax=Pseudodesulfovibrio cashew TaxID=2678688 RepID=A0A6I6JFS1_9BACT|nr:VTT domain-containing protein [Pseudodesulfovibrio cashew]QGY41676.1 SNARE associated Golgi protein [Pseudodesulfovibrio cashew]